MTHAASHAEVRVAVDHANDFLAEDATECNLTHIERDSCAAILGMAERINKLVEALDDSLHELLREDITFEESCGYAEHRIKQSLADYRGTKE